MKIAFVSSEASPFSKSGGLADVAQSLPRALAEHGHAVTLFTPGYPDALEQAAGLGGFSLVEPRRPAGEAAQHFRYMVGRIGQVVAVLVCGPAFERSGMYLAPDGADYPDNPARFAGFCQAVLHWYSEIGEAPDIFHCNDWQAALLPLYLRRAQGLGFFEQSRSVFTIHNLGYQGIGSVESFTALGLPREYFSADGLEFFDQINLLKAGIIYSDALTTVSPTYAAEILEDENGMGLAGLLRSQQGKLCGILNGIDLDEWNPAGDPALPAPFDAGSLSRRGASRHELARLFGLPQRRGLLLGMVARLDRQKGVGLVLDIADELARNSIRLVVLGSGDRLLEQRLAAAAERHPRSISAHIGYDEELARLIYGGADAFLMPSLYEPCGLSQLYAQRYGCVPIVRNTGGLHDTVASVSKASLKDGSAGGFRFGAFEPLALLRAVLRAKKLRVQRPRRWKRLQRCIMRLDNSWTRSARDYEALYAQAILAPAGQGRADG